VLRGVVHGNTIELLDNSGMSDGEQVEVIVRPLFQNETSAGDGFRRTEGALVDDPEWDEIMSEIQQSRIGE
jgi:hypothetical protein